MAGPEKIKSILKNLVDIDSLTKIAKANYELEQILSGTIPPEIEEDVFFGHFEDKIVTLLVNNSTVATKVDRGRSWKLRASTTRFKPMETGKGG